MKGEVGAESQEEGARDKKPSRRQRQRQTELSEEAVRTHISTQTSHLRIMRVGLRLKGVIWAGAPCGERVTARSPRPAISTPAPPRAPAPPPACTPLSLYTQTGLQLQEVPELLGHHPPSTTSVDWLGARPDPAAPPHSSPSLPCKQERRRR